MPPPGVARLENVAPVSKGHLESSSAAAVSQEAAQPLGEGDPGGPPGEQVVIQSVKVSRAVTYSWVRQWMV